MIKYETSSIASQRRPDQTREKTYGSIIVYVRRAFCPKIFQLELNGCRCCRRRRRCPRPFHLGNFIFTTILNAVFHHWHEQHTCSKREKNATQPATVVHDVEVLNRYSLASCRYSFRLRFPPFPSIFFARCDSVCRRQCIYRPYPALNCCS